MPRQPNVAIENNFSKGMVTSASAMSFPANAVTSASNCVFDFLGDVSRREGFDLEQGNVPKTVNYQSQAISSFLWHNVTGDNTTNVYVVQIGGKLYFYPVTLAGSAISAQIGAASPLDFSGFSSQATNSFIINPAQGSVISGAPTTATSLRNPLSSFDGITVVNANNTTGVLCTNDTTVNGIANTVSANTVSRAFIGKDYGAVAGGTNPGPQRIGTATLTGSNDLGPGATWFVYQQSNDVTTYTYQFQSQTATVAAAFTAPQSVVGWQVEDHLGNSGTITSQTFVGSSTGPRGTQYNYSFQISQTSQVSLINGDTYIFFLGSSTISTNIGTSYTLGTVFTTLNQTSDVTTNTNITQPSAPNVTVNLRASNTAPTSANDAGSIILGTRTGAGTITSTNQVTAWRYVWFEVINTATNFSGVPAATDSGAIVTGGTYTIPIGTIVQRIRNTYAPISILEEIAIAEAQFFTPATSVGSPFVNNFECQYANGLGFLFVTHPWCYPFVVGYTPSVNPTGVSAGTITNAGSSFTTGTFVNITMTGGSGSGAICTIVAAGGIVTSITITTAGSGYAVGDTLGLTGVGSGTGVVFTITGLVPPTYQATPIVIQTRDFDGVDDGLQLATGANTNIATRPAVGYTIGTPASVTSSNPLYNGARYDQLHEYNLQNQGWSPTYLNTWAAQVGVSGSLVTAALPSNCDVWWYYKNSSGIFTPPTTSSPAIDVGSTAAPKGSFIFDAFYIDRGALVQATSSISAPGAGTLGIIHSALNRPSTVAFFAGRAWYAGVNYPNFSNCIWFSQILSPTSSTIVASLGQCYQTNDPTSSQTFDLLPTDGGTIRIPDCGTIIKLFPMQGAILVFATNGIWVISGSKGGLGFTANDYSINRLSTMNCLSGQSIVDVQGQPMFWTNEGIYTIRTNLQAGGLQIQSMTYSTIDEFYKDIPRNSKVYARGAYNPFDFTVQWLYRSTAPTTVPDDNYKYDSVLVFNTLTGSFSPYTISTGHVNVASIVCVETGLETDVTPNFTTYTFKYFVTYPDTLGNLRINIADMFSTRYLDWYSYDNIGQNYVSTFTSGYKFVGQGIQKGIPDYIYFYVKNSPTPNSYKVQSIRDYGLDATSGKWSSINLFTNSSTHFSNFVRRHRLRGRGLVLQYKVTSFQNDPFDILGWAIWTTAGQQP